MTSRTEAYQETCIIRSMLKCLKCLTINASACGLVTGAPRSRSYLSDACIGLESMLKKRSLWSCFIDMHPFSTRARALIGLNRRSLRVRVLKTQKTHPMPLICCSSCIAQFFSCSSLSSGLRARRSFCRPFRQDQAYQKIYIYFACRPNELHDSA